jgi:hypothetical protein
MGSSGPVVLVPEGKTRRALSNFKVASNLKLQLWRIPQAVKEVRLSGVLKLSLPVTTPGIEKGMEGYIIRQEQKPELEQKPETEAVFVLILTEDSEGAPTHF